MHSALSTTTYLMKSVVLQWLNRAVHAKDLEALDKKAERRARKRSWPLVVIINAMPRQEGRAEGSEEVRAFSSGSH